MAWTRILVAALPPFSRRSSAQRSEQQRTPASPRPPPHTHTHTQQRRSAASTPQRQYTREAQATERGGGLGEWVEGRWGGEQRRGRSGIDPRLTFALRSTLPPSTSPAPLPSLNPNSRPSSTIDRQRATPRTVWGPFQSAKRALRGVWVRVIGALLCPPPSSLLLSLGRSQQPPYRPCTDPTTPECCPGGSCEWLLRSLWVVCSLCVP